MGNIPATPAFLIDWGWLRIGPYIHINMDPAIVHLGPLKLTWYGMAYVVGIIMGLWFIQRYTARKGVSQDQVYKVLWWCVIAGVVGGRLYFVVQQPDLVQDFLLQPWHILATWEGGMAFFGAIFLVIPTLFWRSLRMRINPLVMLDAGALFAACGQIFGRFGNLVNGDITGYQSTLPWSTVYDNPNSWACPNIATCHVPLQPAAFYELLLNILMIAVLLILARRYRKPGALIATYLFGYCITQFTVFFVRANDVVSLGPLNWGLKQAQWTSIIVFILLIPITIFFMRTRYARPVPDGEVAATYGIPQVPELVLPDDEDNEDAEQVSPTPDEESNDSSVAAQVPLDEENNDSSVAAQVPLASDEEEESDSSNPADQPVPVEENGNHAEVDPVLPTPDSEDDLAVVTAQSSEDVES
jgi:phosphatidylglycerol---prolipoprotein diacylglyceryl transferase